MTDYTKRKQRKKVSPWILVQVHEYDYIKNEPTNHICTFQIKRNNLRTVKKILNEAFKKENMF